MDTVLNGRTVQLRRFTSEMISDRYMGWLGDPHVNFFSRRRNMPPVTAAEAADYLDSLGPEEMVFGIHTEEFGHVGNIGYGPIDRINERSQIGIVIGESSQWGKGIGTEAVYLVTRHLFFDHHLHRVESGSSNPAFTKLTQKLGWTVEGVERDRVKIDGEYFSETLVAQLRHEFTTLPQLEPIEPPP